MNNEEIDAAVADLSARRLAAFSNVDYSLYFDARHPKLVAMEDATTTDDLHMLHGARKSLDERSLAILDLYVSIWQSFARGLRCGVCGRTTRQNAALGYDCIREC